MAEAVRAWNRCSSDIRRWAKCAGGLLLTAPLDSTLSVEPLCQRKSNFFMETIISFSSMLKGQCHQIFDLNFFARPHINRLKRCCKLVRFREDIR